MSQQTFAIKMVKLMEDALSKNTGIKQITADGQTVQFDSQAEMLKMLDYYRRQAKGRSRFQGFNMGSAWY